jgi:hypothetical protein
MHGVWRMKKGGEREMEECMYVWVNGNSSIVVYVYVCECATQRGRALCGMTMLSMSS